MVRPPHCLQYFLWHPALFCCLDFIWSVDGQIPAGFPTALGLLVKQSRGPGLFRDEQMEQLCCAAEHKLDPEEVSPMQILLNRPTTNAPDDGTKAGPERRPEYGVLLFIGSEHVSDHSESDRASSGRKAYQVSHCTSQKRVIIYRQ
jgi:hypothetical protein